MSKYRRLYRMSRHIENTLEQDCTEMKFDNQPTDKLGKLLRGRKDTFAPAVSALRG